MGLQIPFFSVCMCVYVGVTSYAVSCFAHFSHPMCSLHTYSHPDSQPLPYFCIDMNTERQPGQFERQKRGGHGRPRQCMTPTPPLLRFRKERWSETGLLGDLAQCKHSTICCSEIWSGLAKSGGSLETRLQGARGSRKAGGEHGIQADNGRWKGRKGMRDMSGADNTEEVLESTINMTRSSIIA